LVKRQHYFQRFKFCNAGQFILIIERDAQIYDINTGQVSLGGCNNHVQAARNLRVENIENENEQFGN